MSGTFNPQDCANQQASSQSAGCYTGAVRNDERNVEPCKYLAIVLLAVRVQTGTHLQSHVALDRVTESLLD